ncbi:MAG: efflux RND transporter permease subunit [Raineya sp.]
MLSPFRIIFIFLVLSVAGFALVSQLSVDLMPARYEPVLQVSYTIPQTDPATVEQLVTAPLENAFSQIPNLKKIYSVSRYDRGYITLHFQNIEQLAFARFEIANLIRQIYPKLPQNCSYPQVEQVSEEDDEKSPLLVYSVNASLASFQIKKNVEELFKNRLASNPSVEKVEVLGAENLQIIVRYLPEKLLLYQISPSEILRKIQERTQKEYIGLLKEESQQFFVRIENSNIELQDLKNIPIKYLKNAETQLQEPVFLHQLAEISLEEQEANSYFRINGLNSVRLLLYTRKGVNQIAVARALQSEVQAIAKYLPKGFQLILESNQVESLAQEIEKNYKRAAFSLAILLIFTLLWYRNWRDVVILLGSVFTNLALLSLVLYFLNISIHLYTLAGITVSLGLVMDNAVMVLQYFKRKDAFKDWSGLLNALLGTCLCIVAALLFVFFLPEKERMNLSDFVIVVACNMLLSVLVASLFTPALSRFLHGNQVGKKKKFRYQRRQYKFFVRYVSFIGFLQKYPKFFTTAMILLFGLPVFLLPTQIPNNEWYNKTFGNEWYLENIRPFIDKYLGGTLRLFAYNVYENAGYRNLDRTVLYINAEMPLGTTPEQMNQVIQKVENYLKKVENLEKFITSVYSGQYAQIIVYFDKKAEKSALPYQLKNRIIALSLDMGGVTWGIYGVGEGFSNATGEQMNSFRVEMRGYNLQELERQAEKLAQKLLTHKRIQSVNTNEKMNYYEKSATQLTLNLDAEKMKLAQINASNTMEAIKFWAKPSTPQGFVFVENRYIPVLFKAQEAENFSQDFLKNNLMRDLHNLNRNFKISTVGAFNEIKTGSAIHKENREYIRLVAFEYMGSNKFGQEFLDKKLAEMRLEMPAGYRVSQKEFSFFSREQKKRQYELLAIVFAGIFAVCSIVFESFRKAFYTILTIPVSFIGLFSIFYVGNFYFDQGGYASFILLSGTTVASAIFILNEWNMQSYRPNRELLKVAFKKFVPVLTTILTTLLGFVPFLSEGDREVFWFSLAIGSMGGLLASLWAVWVCLPVWSSMFVKSRLTHVTYFGNGHLGVASD